MQGVLVIIVLSIAALTALAAKPNSRLERLNKARLSFNRAFAHSSPAPTTTRNKLDERAKLTVKNHGPCSQNKQPNEMIRLATNKEAPVRPIPGRDGCYALTGRAEVFRKMVPNFQVYTEIRYRPEADLYAPERCIRPNATRENEKNKDCGGWGSCVYCQGCEHAKTYKKSLDAAEVKIVHNGKEMACDTSLDAGVYNNIGFHFCLPSRREYLSKVGQDEAYRRFEELEEYVGDVVYKQDIFVKFYVFEFPVDKFLATSDQIAQARYGDRALNATEHAGLPFSSFLRKNQLHIACHALFADIELDNN